MDKYSIVSRIEEFAPPETAEGWDCSGWLVETNKKEISKIMLALTVTDNIIIQAKQSNCDMIISHHPLFEVPILYKDIDIYCAHTNMDLAAGGTTDSLIEKLATNGLPVEEKIVTENSFVRYVKTEISENKLLTILSKISPNLRYVNKNSVKNFNILAFCAGSGSEFISEASEYGADGFITGDLKFHTALDSKIPVFDIGHFESEIQVLRVFKNILPESAETIYATETTPFKSFVHNNENMII